MQQKLSQRMQQTARIQWYKCTWQSTCGCEPGILTFKDSSRKWRLVTTFPCYKQRVAATSCAAFTSTHMHALSRMLCGFSPMPCQAPLPPTAMSPNSWYGLVNWYMKQIKVRSTNPARSADAVLSRHQHMRALMAPTSCCQQICTYTGAASATYHCNRCSAMMAQACCAIKQSTSCHHTMLSRLSRLAHRAMQQDNCRCPFSMLRCLPHHQSAARCEVHPIKGALSCKHTIDRPKQHCL